MVAADVTIMAEVQVAAVDSEATETQALAAAVSAQELNEEVLQELKEKKAVSDREPKVVLTLKDLQDARKATEMSVRPVAHSKQLKADAPEEVNLFVNFLVIIINSAKNLKVIYYF